LISFCVLVFFPSLGSSGDTHDIDIVLNGTTPNSFLLIPEKNPQELLKAIYKEVLELGVREGEDFIKREFHFDLDGNEANKEEHIVIMSYEAEEGEKLLVQVTYFEANGANRIIRNAWKVKQIRCDIKNDVLKIKDCSYTDEEIKELLPDILSGIREEIKLLELVDKNSDH